MAEKEQSQKPSQSDAQRVIKEGNNTPKPQSDNSGSGKPTTREKK